MKELKTDASGLCPVGRTRARVAFKFSLTEEPESCWRLWPEALFPAGRRETVFLPVMGASLVQEAEQIYSGFRDLGT